MLHFFYICMVWCSVVGEGVLYSLSPLSLAEMRPLQLSALENQAAKQETTTVVTRKRRRVSFAPETQATHEDDDIIITKVVESNKDLDLQGRDATSADSPQLKEPRTLDTPHQHSGAGKRLLESTVGDSETPKPPQVESSLENPDSVIPRCETKHSESPPDLPAKLLHRALEVEGQPKDRLSDEDSIASSVSSVTSDVTTGKKKRGRPKGRSRVSAIKKTKMNLPAVKAQMQEQKEQEAVKEGIDVPEGATVKSRKRHRRTRGGKSAAAAAAVATMAKEAEDGMGERESEVGESGREGETKKRRLSQDDEPEAPETARGEEP